MRVGELFGSYSEFITTLKEYENEKFVSFSKRDSRKIESIRHKIKHPLKSELEYYEVKFNCIRGGPFCYKGTGKRKTSTFKTDCPAHISLRVTPDGKNLQIRTLNECHNHEISEDLFRHLPQQRKLPPEVKENAKELLDLNVNKKLLQQKLQRETGKIVTLKDLSNLAAQDNRSNDLCEAVTFLQEKYDVDIEILKGQDDTFEGLFIQTSRMKRIFESFPEFIAFDATYKLLNLNLPTFIFLVEDGNCESEIVGIAVTTNELKETLNWMVKTFKHKNPASVSTKVIMTDKDLTERNVFKTHFESADLLLCIFHCLRTFGREITVEKYGITSVQRTLYLQILQKMVCAPSEAVFHENLQKFESVAPNNIKLYYYENWHCIRSQWCKSAQMGKANFLNCTNNRLESMNSKLKSTVKKNSSIVEYVEKLFSLIDTLQNERRHKGITMLQKNRIIKQSCGVLVDYEGLLTNNVFAHIEREIERFEENKYVIAEQEQENNFTVNSSLGLLKVTPQSCECSFHTSMLLPCRHIFAVRHSICMPLFEPDLVNERWKKSYYLHYLQTILNPSTKTEDQSLTISAVPTTSKPKSVQTKRRIATAITNDIADAISLLPENEFQKTLNLLKEFKNNIINRNFLIPNPEPSQNPLEAPPEPSQSTSIHEQHQSYNMSLPDQSQDIAVSELSFDMGEATPNVNNVLRSIKMPPVIKKRGRPKGHDLTVIGVPKKKKSNKPLPFIYHSIEEKEMMLLQCFVSKERAPSARLRTIEEEEVNVLPEMVPNKVIDKQVDINLIQKYFSADAWKIVEQVINLKQKDPKWICSTCSKDLAENKSIGCDGCLEWYHLQCVGMKTCPRTKHWMCLRCK